MMKQCFLFRIAQIDHDMKAHSLPFFWMFLATQPSNLFLSIKNKGERAFSSSMPVSFLFDYICLIKKFDEL